MLIKLNGKHYSCLSFRAVHQLSLFMLITGAANTDLQLVVLRWPCTVYCRRIEWKRPWAVICFSCKPGEHLQLHSQTQIWICSSFSNILIPLFNNTFRHAAIEHTWHFNFYYIYNAWSIIISINMSAEETEKSDSNTAGTCTNIDTTWLWFFGVLFRHSDKY